MDEDDQAAREQDARDAIREFHRAPLKGLEHLFPHLFPDMFPDFQAPTSPALLRQSHADLANRRGATSSTNSTGQKKRTFTCSNCEKKYVSRERLRYHLEEARNRCTDPPDMTEEEKDERDEQFMVHKCPKCGKGCRNTNNLNFHSKTCTSTMFPSLPTTPTTPPTPIGTVPRLGHQPRQTALSQTAPKFRCYDCGIAYTSLSMLNYHKREAWDRCTDPPEMTAAEKDERAKALTSTGT
ncbi:hypothetical protein BU16DRAFT_567338 [Lophium mytilinum]|uniref:C2H2-type domain-containing protein n=1 Tax=Lophium mytilinum TaxID=390894 RepID=A0A6A6Q9Z6_9PEZI|nr:hypothetical protein BU16DRAFT_567338 [Lophium mytilinum]